MELDGRLSRLRLLIIRVWRLKTIQTTHGTRIPTEKHSPSDSHSGIRNDHLRRVCQSDTSPGCGITAVDVEQQTSRVKLSPTHCESKGWGMSVHLGTFDCSRSLWLVGPTCQSNCEERQYEGGYRSDQVFDAVSPLSQVSHPTTDWHTAGFEPPTFSHWTTYTSFNQLKWNPKISQ